MRAKMRIVFGLGCAVALQQLLIFLCASFGPWLVLPARGTDASRFSAAEVPRIASPPVGSFASLPSSSWSMWRAFPVTFPWSLVSVESSSRVFSIWQGIADAGLSVFSCDDSSAVAGLCHVFSGVGWFPLLLAGLWVLGVMLGVVCNDAAPGSDRYLITSTDLLPFQCACTTRIMADDAMSRVTGGFGATVRSVCSKVAAARRNGDLGEKINLLCTAVRLKYHSRTKRHFFYLLTKNTLKVKINKGESVQQSYLDLKRNLQSKLTWPFMWEVSNVTSALITCQGTPAIPMSSYSYLDMIREPQVQAAAIEAARKWSTGNHGDRMGGGNCSILRDLERVVGRFFGREDSLVLSAGYLACLSTIMAVGNNGDLMLADSKSHASIRAGLRACDAKTIYFRHNNFRNVERLLRQHRHRYNDCWIVMESVYSMDGDIGDLPAASAIAKTHRCKIIMDEAHGLGVLGNTGRGIEEYFNMPGACEIVMGTFSKSVGGIGGYIAGNKDLIDYLDAHAPGTGCSAPLTAYSAGTTHTGANQQHG
eukprot:GHVT01006385.1.p1 GENE.GHVT01006385.1~~GHVT01006385.1.p1  ORF type:complete len:535 (+),score=79.48 GHVT01006385.1:997-2601(+)